jgi:hypothetical protein
MQAHTNIVRIGTVDRRCRIWLEQIRLRHVVEQVFLGRLRHDLCRVHLILPIRKYDSM